MCKEIAAWWKAFQWAFDWINKSLRHDRLHWWGTSLISQDYEFDSAFDVFKYKGVIGLDISDKSFQLKRRILGV